MAVGPSAFSPTLDVLSTVGLAIVIDIYKDLITDQTFSSIVVARGVTEVPIQIIRSS